METIISSLKTSQRSVEAAWDQLRSSSASFKDRFGYVLLGIQNGEGNLRLGRFSSFDYSSGASLGGTSWPSTDPTYRIAIHQHREVLGEEEETRSSYTFGLGSWKLVRADVTHFQSDTPTAEITELVQTAIREMHSLFETYVATFRRHVQKAEQLNQALPRDGQFLFQIEPYNEYPIRTEVLAKPVAVRFDGTVGTLNQLPLEIELSYLERTGKIIGRTEELRSPRVPVGNLRVAR